MTRKNNQKKGTAKGSQAKARPKAPVEQSKATSPLNYAAMDLETLKKTAEELHVATADKILEEAEGLRNDYMAAVKAIERAMSKYGITASEFLSTEKSKLRRAIVAHLRGDSRQSIAPRFQHPEHANLTWTGRGSRPRWLRDLLEAGRDIEEFRVQR
jgi:DNA-binding protein H-NS